MEAVNTLYGNSLGKLFSWAGTGLNDPSKLMRIFCGKMNKPFRFSPLKKKIGYKHGNARHKGDNE